MIECKNCGLPALPPVLFWEGLFRMRLPCLCGCMERAGSADVGIEAGMPAKMIDADMMAEMRAADDGMPERGVLMRRVGKAQDFRKWLETRDKRKLAATAANTDRGIIVKKEFRPVRLKKLFDAQNGAPERKLLQPDPFNPYMSGMDALAKVF
jgi:hypothetical protein